MMLLMMAAFRIEQHARAGYRYDECERDKYHSAVPLRRRAANYISGFDTIGWNSAALHSR